MQFPGYTKAVAVTPSDTVNLDGFTVKALYVGGAGAIAAVINGAVVSFPAVPVGTVLPIATTRVNATGTAATNIVALGD